MPDLPPPTDDGLKIPEVRPWSRDKHHFLERYIDMFTTTMKDKRWSGLHYIDLFAGAGIERIRGTDELDWGSPLIAAQARYPFTGLHLCEEKPRLYEALKKRLAGRSPCTPPSVRCGDGNVLANEIVEEIPQGSLSLAFLDPFGLDLDFKTLGVLSSSLRHVDFIIYFPDRVDMLRNWELYRHQDGFGEGERSNMTRFFGDGAGWEGVCDRYSGAQRPARLRDCYEAQVKTLGYNYFEHQRIRDRDGRPLYQLILCAKHELAAKLWQNAVGKGVDGQTSFNFDDPP